MIPGGIEVHLFAWIHFGDGPYKYRSIWNNEVFCCFGNIKMLDQALVQLEQLRI